MSVFSVTGGRYSEWPMDLLRDAQWVMADPPELPDGDPIPEPPRTDPVPPEDEPAEEPEGD